MIGESAATVQHSNIQDIYPLTPMQNGILFHVLKAERSGPYIEQFVFAADQIPDLDRLAAAWTAVVQRHPALRTSFVWEGVDEPLQIVAGECSVPMICKDLTGLEPEGVDDHLQEFLAQDRAQGIALATAPLMRLTVLAHDRGCVVVWTLHHLIMDGWSMPITVAEVAAHYRSAAAGVAPALPVPRPFREYVTWLRGSQTPELEAYWRGQLQGTRPTPVRLRTPGLAAERAGTASAGRAYLDLGAGLSAALMTTAREARVTLSTLFQAAWSVLIARHADADDVIFGLAVSGRPPELTDVEGIVGVFINTIARRILVDDAARLGPWLRDIQRGYLDTVPHQHAGLPDIQRLAGLPDGTPLFDSIVVFENYPNENPDFDLGGGVALKVREIVEDAGYPLTLTVLPRQPGIRLQLLHDPALFDDEMATTLLGRLETALTALVSGLHRTVGQIDVLSEQTRSATAGLHALPSDLVSALPSGLSTAPAEEVHAHVLDSALRLTPAGVVGAIHIGGAGWLARAATARSGGHDTGLRGFRSDVGVLAVTTDHGSGNGEAGGLERTGIGGAAAEEDLFQRPAARVLRDLWTEILRRPVTAETDFFRAGGDSLAAVRLVGRIRTMFHAPVPVNALFEDRSMANLLDRIDLHTGGAKATDDIASAQDLAVARVPRWA